MKQHQSKSKDQHASASYSRPVTDAGFASRHCHHDHDQSSLRLDSLSSRISDFETLQNLKPSPLFHKEQSGNHSVRSSNDSRTPFDLADLTPAPHLPLRRQASLELRSNKPVPRKRHFEIPQAYNTRPTFPLHGTSQPAAATVVRESVHGKNYTDTLQWPRPEHMETRTTPINTARRPSTTQNRSTLEASTIVAPITSLRSSASVPDCKGVKTLSRGNASSRIHSDASQNARTSIRSIQRQSPTFWRDGGAASVRDSLLSILTNSSSGLDLSGTERSSLFSHRSSATDYDSHIPSWPRIQEEEMSAEDCIALYETDSPDKSVEKDTTPELVPPIPPISSRRYGLVTSTLEPIVVDTAGLDYKPSVPSSLAQVHPANIVVGEHAGLNSLPLDAPQSMPAPVRDRYGFKKETIYVKVQQYDSWNLTYRYYLERRRKKWDSLMKHHNLPTEKPVRFPPRSVRVRRFIRKGIPPEWRGAAWFWYAGGPARVENNPGLYGRLLDRVNSDGLSEGDREHIERDLHRTFPDNIAFKPDSVNVSLSNSGSDGHRSIVIPGSDVHRPASIVESPMIRSLRRVLQAFALYNPRVGYCQSLNFLAGQLLLFMPSSPDTHEDEEKVFHMLCILTSDYLPGTHGVALEGANVDIGVLMETLQEAMPLLWAKIDDRFGTRSNGGSGAGFNQKTTLSTTIADMPTVSLATTAWFMSCFVSTLPVETCCRVWDCLFYEGSQTLFNIALGIFKLAEPDIKLTTDPMEVFQLVQTLPRTLIDANALMETTFKKWNGSGYMTKETVEQRRQARRDIHARERLRTLTMPSSPQLHAESTETVDETTMTRLRRSMSRARLKRDKTLKKH